MKKTLLFMLGMVFPVLLSAQDKPTPRPDYMRSGFYLKLGPVLPMGDFAKGQTVQFPVKDLDYIPARIGAALDMGSFIYIGPSFANNYLRVGIDATFLSAWFNSTRPEDRDNLVEKYYSFLGQKFGPVITLNPVDKLLLDFSYKLNANFAYHDEITGWAPHTDGSTSEYGYNLFGNEVSLGIRYSVMFFSFQYNFGTMNYNNAEKENTAQIININTFRIMIGFKI